MHCCSRQRKSQQGLQLSCRMSTMWYPVWKRDACQSARMKPIVLFFCGAVPEQLRCIKTIGSGSLWIQNNSIAILQCWDPGSMDSGGPLACIFCIWPHLENSIFEVFIGIWNLRQSGCRAQQLHCCPGVESIQGLSLLRERWNLTVQALQNNSDQSIAIKWTFLEPLPFSRSNHNQTELTVTSEQLQELHCLLNLPYLPLNFNPY